MTLTRENEPASGLKDFLRALRKHRWLITGIFLVTVITVAIWTFQQVPIFQAAATILIDPEPPRILNIQEVQPIGAARPWDLQTQYAIIQSRAVLTKALETLNVNKRGAELDAAREPYRALPGSLTVQPRRNTRLVLIQVEHPNPALAAKVANAVATAYVRYNLELKLRGAGEALAWLTQEAARLKAQVRESSVALQNYRIKTGILGMQEQRQITAQKIMDFNKAYLEAQAQRLSIEAKLREVTEVAKDKAGAETIFTVADTPLIQGLKEQTFQLEVEKAKLRKVYKKKHPEILKINARIQRIEQRLDAEIQTMLRALQTEYQVAKAREETLLENVNQLRREGQELNETEIHYRTLQGEYASNQQLYEAVVKRLKETAVTEGIETNNVRVVEQARPPTVPVKPRKTRNLIYSIVAGLVLGIGLAVAIEYFDTTLRTPDDVERSLGLSVIGIIPVFGGKRR